MKKMTIKAAIGLLCFWGLLADNACMAQTDSTKHRVARALLISAAHLKPRECTAIETLTTAVVTFDSSARVENIFLSETDDCLTRNKENFVEFLTSELNGLNLAKKEFSNGYILFVLFVTKLGETKTTSNVTTEVFINMFNNLDEAQVAGKELKLWMPAVEYVYKPSH